MSGSGEQFVHFIRRKDDEGPVAIGASPDPQHALAVMQLGNPEELRLLGAVDANRYPEEWWHDTLSPWHRRGLWYEPKAQVLCRIEDALRGALDDPRLPEPPSAPPEPPEPSEAAPDAVPADLRERLVQAEERARQQARDKWAWPEVDPYPITAEIEASILQKETLDPASKKAILGKLHRAAKSSSVAPDRS